MITGSPSLYIFSKQVGIISDDDPSDFTGKAEFKMAFPYHATSTRVLNIDNSIKHCSTFAEQLSNKHIINWNSLLITNEIVTGDFYKVMAKREDSEDYQPK